METPVDGAELLDAVAAAIRRYIVLPDHARDAGALWIVAHVSLRISDVSRGWPSRRRRRAAEKQPRSMSRPPGAPAAVGRQLLAQQHSSALSKAIGRHC